MDENVAKALDRVHVVITSSHLPGWKENRQHWQTIRARLVELEAENERLRADCDLRFEQAMQSGQSARERLARVEKAEALLREAMPFCDTFPDLLRDGGDELRARITAHLSENGHG